MKGRDREEVFVRCLEGVFDAIHISELRNQAEDYIKNLSRHIFTQEIAERSPSDTTARRFPGPMLACYLETFPASLARENPMEKIKSQELATSIITDLVSMAVDAKFSQVDVLRILHHITGRFSSLCLEPGWLRKSAGCAGIKIIAYMPGLGQKCVTDRDVNVVRTLLHVLKDMPYDLTRDVDEVMNVMTLVLRLSSANIPQSQPTDPPQLNKLIHLTSIFFQDLSNPNPLVRSASQKCLQLLSELTDKSLVDLLMPLRDKILATLYTKPLRALPFSIQIGIIEAVRYCVSLETHFVELNDELLRLLHEVLALADAEDAALLGRANPRQSLIEITKLRVACIKLLTASMPMTDFFAKQIQTRQKWVYSCLRKP